MKEIDQQLKAGLRYELAKKRLDQVKASGSSDLDVFDAAKAMVKAREAFRQHDRKEAV